MPQSINPMFLMRKPIIVFLTAFSICFLQFTACIQAQSSSSEHSQVVIQQLKAENEALKKELQLLRQLMASSLSGASNSPATGENRTGTAASPLSTQGESTGYWMTLSSRKRHNSSCRYFQNSNGKHCGPEDGIPCKLCGG